MEDVTGAFLSSLFAAFTSPDATRAQKASAVQSVARPADPESHKPRREEPADPAPESPLRDERDLAPGSIDPNPLRADDAPKPPPQESDRPAPRAAPRARGSSDRAGPVTGKAAKTRAASSPAPARASAAPSSPAAPAQPAPATFGQGAARSAGAVSPPAQTGAPVAPASRTGPAVQAASRATAGTPTSAKTVHPASGPAPDIRGAGAARRAARAAEARPHAAPRTTETVEVQLARALATALRAGQGGASITLRPESLGAVHVRLDVRDSTVRARIEASSEEAARLLRSAAPALHQALTAKGLEVASVDVVASGDAEARSLGTDAQEHPGEGSHTPRDRAGSGHASEDDAGPLHVGAEVSMPLTVDASGAIRVDALV